MRTLKCVAKVGVISFGLCLTGCSKEPAVEGRLKVSTSENTKSLDTEPEAVVLDTAKAPPDALSENSPCYLEQEVEKVVLTLDPLIDKEQANFRSWASRVLLKKQGFSFKLDAEDFKITDGDGAKRKRSILEQLLWVCSSADQTGFPPRHPDACVGVTVKSTEMLVSFSSQLSAQKKQPDGAEGASGSAYVLTMSKKDLGWEEGDSPILVKNLSQFDFRWTLEYQADDTGTALRENYLTVGEGDTAQKVGHIPAAYPPLKSMSLRVNDLPHYLWVKTVGGLYYAKPQGFFKSKAHPEEGKGTYELTHEPAASGRSSDGARGVSDYYENPFTHHFVDSDITKDSWYQIHKKHCEKIKKK